MSDLFASEPCLRKHNPLKRSEKRGSADTSQRRQVFLSMDLAVRSLSGRLGEPSHVWQYVDPAGKTAGATIRWDQPDGSKEIRPVSLTESGWVIGAMTEPRPLYRVDEVTASQNETLYVAEGEKCAESLRSIGCVCTTSSGGSQAAGKTDWSPLAGRRVVVIPDNDEPGRTYGEAVVGQLLRLKPKPSVRLFDLKEVWPELPGKGDVADWITAHSSEQASDLKERLEAAASEVEPIESEFHAPMARTQFEPFPVDVLPEKLRRLVTDGSRSIGCDPASIAVPLLSACGATIGNSHRLRLKRGWDVPPIVWSVVVGKSGSGKSPAWKLAMEPTCQVESQRHRDHKKNVANWLEEQGEFSKRHAEWKKSDGQEPEPQPPAQPIEERLTVVDTTVEGLAPLLQDNPRGFLLARDELSGWVGSFDRYAKGGGGADASHWLSMFNGSSIRIDRKTGEPRSICIPAAAVSVTGTIQPGILRKAFAGENVENGLLYRFLFAFPQDTVTRWNDQGVSQATLQGAVEVFENLYSLDFNLDRFGESQPAIVALDDDAKAAFVEFFNKHRTEQRDLCDELASAWAKLEEYAARLALILHLTRRADSPDSVGQKVDLTSMEGGIRLTRWFCNEFCRIHEMMTSSEEERLRDELADWIRRRGGSVSARDVQTGNRRLATSQEAEAALSELVEYDYGEWVDAPSGSRGGRPTRRFQLFS